MHRMSLGNKSLYTIFMSLNLLLFQQFWNLFLKTTDNVNACFLMHIVSFFVCWFVCLFLQMFVSFHQ